MKPLTSIGLDLSATASGIVLLKENGSKTPLLMLEKEIKPGALRGAARMKRIALEVMETIHEHKPDKIVVEGYSLGKNVNSTIPLVEIGGLVRFLMHLDGLTWFDPRASEVKKFATGSGSAPKDQVMMWVLKRWAHTSISNNTADAYTLAAMGLAQANRLPGLTQPMRAIAGGMMMRKT